MLGKRPRRFEQTCRSPDRPSEARPHARTVSACSNLRQSRVRLALACPALASLPRDSVRTLTRSPSNGCSERIPRSERPPRVLSGALSVPLGDSGRRTNKCGSGGVVVAPLDRTRVPAVFINGNRRGPGGGPARLYTRTGAALPAHGPRAGGEERRHLRASIRSWSPGERSPSGATSGAQPHGVRNQLSVLRAEYRTHRRERRARHDRRLRVRRALRRDRLGDPAAVTRPGAHPNRAINSLPST